MGSAKRLPNSMDYAGITQSGNCTHPFCWSGAFYCVYVGPRGSREHFITDSAGELRARRGTRLDRTGDGDALTTQHAVCVSRSDRTPLQDFCPKQPWGRTVSNMGCTACGCVDVLLLCLRKKAAGLTADPPPKNKSENAGRYFMQQADFDSARGAEA